MMIVKEAVERILDEIGVSDDIPPENIEQKIIEIISINEIYDVDEIVELFFEQCADVKY